MHWRNLFRPTLTSEILISTFKALMRAGLNSARYLESKKLCQKFDLYIIINTTNLDLQVNRLGRKLKLKIPLKHPIVRHS